MSARLHDLRRLPGLFRRWELVQVLEPGRDYHLEAAGRTVDGAELVAVYRGEAPPAAAATEADG